MDNKKTLYRLIEYYLNDSNLELVEDFYGKGSRIKIHSLSYSTNLKTLLVEAVVVLGETIDEEVIDSSMAEILIKDGLVYFYPEYKVNTLIRWDA
jgi:hypothetical protein